jgi:hypothetical protein
MAMQLLIAKMFDAECCRPVPKIRQLIPRVHFKETVLFIFQIPNTACLMSGNDSLCLVIMVSTARKCFTASVAVGVVPYAWFQQLDANGTATVYACYGHPCNCIHN